MIEFLIVTISLFVLIVIGFTISSITTKPINILSFLIITFLLNIFIKNDNIWIYSLQITTSILFSLVYIVLIKSKSKLNYNKKILSFSYLINIFRKPNSNERIIGKVFPYNKLQLKYNGRNIVADNTAVAGATLISGSTGSGKTYAMLSLIRQNIKNGKSVIFTEFKGDPEVISELEDYARSFGYEIFSLSGDKSNFNYDPLKDINDVGRIEAIINMRKWSLDGADAHYRTSVQLLLQKTVTSFTKKYNEEGRKGSYTMKFYEYLKLYSPARGESDAHITTTKLLELLLTSNLKSTFSFENSKTLSFDNELRKTLITISFVSSNKELATSFSSLLFKDILDQFTNFQSKELIYLYSDEFGTLENPFIIKDILEKGRSAKIATTLSLLDLNQIIINTNAAYLDSLLGIINTFIIYNGATKSTAEKFSGVQLLDIDDVLMNLRKPLNGKSSTGIYISKYPSLNKRINSEVLRFEPYIEKFKTLNNSNTSRKNVNTGKLESDYDIQEKVDKLINYDKKEEKIEIEEYKNSKKDYNNLKINKKENEIEEKSNKEKDVSNFNVDDFL